MRSLTERQAEDLLWDWRFWARPEQLAPDGDWTNWLILAGRGFGKTRTGAEWVRDNVCGSTPLSGGRYRQIALIAETASDARDVMVGDGKGPGEGSGILQVHPAAYRPVYEPSKRRLTWPNGAIATLYNATEPDQLRGPAHDAAWCDELAKWRYAQETWEQLEFGLRLGERPRAVITTTPRPIALLTGDGQNGRPLGLLRRKDTIVTRGSTRANRENLPDSFLRRILDRYEGTRLGRQEIDAEILDDVPGALWTHALIDGGRSMRAPDLGRVVVAIDPAVSTGEDADETGIIVAGRAFQDRARQHGYVLADLSGRYAPSEWARIAVKALEDFAADRIVAEVNNGGDMVEATLRAIDPNLPFTAVRASRGKVVRAEPVHALYEQGRVHHVGVFAALEDQMCAFTADFDRRSSGYSPDRVDALVWALTDLMVQPMQWQGLYEFYRRRSDDPPVEQAADDKPPVYAPGSVEWQRAQGRA